MATPCTSPIIREVELLSADWDKPRVTTFDIKTFDGKWRTERRETYDRGSGAPCCSATSAITVGWPARKPEGQG